MESGQSTSTIRIPAVLLSVLLVTAVFSTVAAGDEPALDGIDSGDSTVPDSHTGPLDRVHPASFDPPSHPATDGVVLANLTLDVDASVDDGVPAQDPVYDRVALEKDAELGVDDAADVNAVWVGGQKYSESVSWEDDDCTVDLDASNVLVWGGFVASDDTYSICETPERIHITLAEPGTIERAAVNLSLTPDNETGTYDLNVTLLETAHGLDHVLGVPYEALLTGTGEAACDSMPAPVRDVVDQLPHGCSFAVVSAQQVPFEVSPAAPDHLHFETQPTSPIDANSTWDPFTVRVEDRFDNLATDDSSVPITVASNATATDTLHGTVTETVSEGIATFDNVTYLTAERIRVNASSPGLDNATSVPVNVTPGALADFTLDCDVSTFTNTSFTCTVPADSGSDNHGNDATLQDVAWSAEDSNGNSVSPAASFENGTFIANFTAPGSADLGPVTVDATGKDADGDTATVTASVSLKGPLATFTLTCDDSAVVNTSFTCSVPADSGEDQFGNDVTVQDVAWSAEDGNGTAIASDDIAFDGSTFTANFTAPDSVDLGPVTVEATGEDAEANTAAENTTVDLFAPAAQLVFVETPQNMTAGEPVGLTIQRQDADGHPVTEEPAVDVDLSTSSAGGEFLNATGATVSTVTIPEGSANVTVSYNDTDAGNQSLTADNASLDAAQHTIEVQPAELTEIGIACDPIEVPAGETTDCEATPLDAFGNERDDEPTWTAHDGGWFDPDTGQTTTYHPPTDVGTYDVSASADGVTSNTMTVEVVPGELHRFVFLDNPFGERVDVSADVAEASVRVQAFDAYDNPIPNQTVHWEIDNGSGGEIAPDPSETEDDGITNVTLTTSNQTGEDFEYRVQAIDDPVDPTVTRRSGLWVVVPGEAHAVLLDGTPTDLAAGETVDLDVAVVDAHGNVLDAGDNDLDGDRNATFAGPSAAPDGTEPVCAGDPVGTTTSLSFDSGTNATACTLYAAEDVTLTLNVSGVPNDGSLDLSVDPADADHLAWTTTPGDRIEVGDCSGFELEVQDPWNNAQPAGNRTVDLSGTGGGAFHTDAGCGDATSQVTLADGQADASLYFNSTVAENLTLNASSTGIDPALHDLTVQPGPATHLEVDCVDPSDCSLTAGGTLDLDLTAEDRFDNVVGFGDHAYEGNQTLLFSGPASSPGDDAPTCEGEEVGQPVNVSFADGAATATCALYRAEDAALAVADGNVTGSVDVTVLPAELDKYAIDPPRGDNQDALQNGTYTVTATALDAFENPIPGQDVNWFLMRGSTNEDPNSGSLDAGITQTDASGEATVNLTVSDDPGDFFRVTAADDSDLVQAETTNTTARFVVRLSVHDGESIQTVLDQEASEGQIVLVEPGTYDETVTVNKTLTLRGAQAGTDARTRTDADESVVGTVSGGFVLTADNVTLDGFTVRGVTDCLQGGISTSPDASGYTINNTIVRDNELGIKLRADGTFETVARHNLLKDNDRAWYDGTCDGVAKAISTGFHQGDVLHNATVDANRFVGHTEGGDSYAIQLVANQGGHGGVTVSGNDLTGDSSIVLADLDGGAIDDNQIVMDDDDSSTAVFVAGNVSDVAISDNLVNGTERGMWFAPDFFGVPTPSSGVDILGNDITGNPTAGLQVADGRYTGDLDVHQNSIDGNGFGVNNTDADLVVDARDNWWGASDGPSGDVADPVTGVLAEGLGDAVSEDPDDEGVSNVRFDPWLTSEP